MARTTVRTKKQAPRPSRRGQAIAYSDTSINESIKSQVEDIDLVNQRRAQFLKEAISLFCHKGYHVTTIKEIASEAGVSAGLIYQYVQDKEDILYLALQHIVHTYRRVLPRAMESVVDPVHKFIVAFEEYCRVIDVNRDASALSYSETKSLSPERREVIKNMEYEVNELLAAPLREGIQAGLVRRVNIELFVTMATLAIHGWALKHWRLKLVTNIDEFIEVNLDILLNSVLTDAGQASYARYRAGRRGRG